MARQFSMGHEQLIIFVLFYSTACLYNTDDALDRQSGAMPCYKI